MTKASIIWHQLHWDRNHYVDVRRKIDTDTNTLFLSTWFTGLVPKYQGFLIPIIEYEIDSLCICPSSNTVPSCAADWIYKGFNCNYGYCYYGLND